MKTFCKESLWKFFYSIAVILPHRPRCTVLLYHSISDNEDFFAVSPKLFEKQMEYLKTHAETISLDNVLSYLQCSRIKRDSVAVTFDDGYRDFVQVALPILKRLEIPATVFVLGEEKEVDRAQLGNELPLLTAEDIQMVQNSIVTIGSHGISHRKLPRLPLDQARKEIEGSRVRIAQVYGKEPTYLAYPKGSWNLEIAKIVKESGYDAAFTVIETSVPMNANHYGIPRIQIDSSTSFAQFKAKLTPAADWYYWLWKLFRKGMV